MRAVFLRPPASGARGSSMFPVELRDFDAILLDMDGTLYRVDQPIPGVSEAIAQLRKLGLRLACLTNNSANTPRELSCRLADMGISVPPSDIHTAAAAMAELILRRFGRARVFNFAGHALPAELAGRADLIGPAEDRCDVVAVGTHFRENAVGFDMEAALAALEYLRRGAHLVVGCADRVFPIQAGGVEFGSGSWAALFAYAAALPTERIHYAGKPEPVFFESLCSRMGLSAQRCLLVGDNLESDIRGGLAMGMKTALVLSGVTRRPEVKQSSFQPDVVADDLLTLVKNLA